MGREIHQSAKSELDQIGNNRNESLPKDNSNDSGIESDIASLNNDHSIASDDNENNLFNGSDNRNSNAFHSEGLSSGLSSYGSSVSIITLLPGNATVIPDSTPGRGPRTTIQTLISQPLSTCFLKTRFKKNLSNLKHILA